MKSPLKRLSYVLAFIGEATPSRSKPAKDRSDNVLSYYESSIPNEPRNYIRASNHAAGPHTRKASTTSMSSDSDYSYDSETDVKGAASEASSSATRRSSAPSKGGADRRRVAIVQMDNANDGSYKNPSEASSSSGSLHSRRGNRSKLAGLALVAPPDAALRSYTHLTPPLSAPITTDSTNNSLLAVHQDKGHNRSASEISSSRNGPTRDQLGIVGASQGSSTPDENKAKAQTEGESRPNGQHTSMANSRSSSPSKRSTISSNLNQSQELLQPLSSARPSQSVIDLFSPIVTPNIGEGKEISDPVAGPVVVKLEDVSMKSGSGTASSWRSESPALASVHTHSRSATPSATPAYLNYEPGKYILFFNSHS